MKHENSVTIVSVIDAALQDAETKQQPKVVANYGGANVPVSIVFTQSFTKDETESGRIFKEVYELDANGKPIFELKEREGITDGKGNKVFERVYKVAGKKDVSIRLKTGGKIPVTFSKVLPFQCSNGKELRVKIGEGFNEMKDYLQGGGKVAGKSQPLHLTVKLNGLILSTTSLNEGGVKISKVYEKGKFKSDLFANEFCRPLWAQICKVQQLLSGKVNEVDQLILSALK